MGMKYAKLFKNNEFVIIPYQEYIDEYCGQIDSIWNPIIDEINEGFDKDNQLVYAKRNNLKHWDVVFVNKKYNELCETHFASLVDASVIKFIAWMYGMRYFDEIGNPKFEDWLNTKNVSKKGNQFDIPEEMSVTIMEVLKYRNGQNGVKSILLSCLRSAGMFR